MLNGKSAVFEIKEVRGKFLSPQSVGGLAKMEVGDRFFLEYPFKDFSKIGPGFYSPTVLVHKIVDGGVETEQGYLAPIVRDMDVLLLQEV